MPPRKTTTHSPRPPSNNKSHINPSSQIYKVTNLKEQSKKTKKEEKEKVNK